LRINFTERRGAKYFSNTWKRRIIVWLHVSNWMWTLKDPEDSADPPHHYQDCIPSQPCLVRINQMVSNPRFLFRSILPNNLQVPRQILFLSGCWTLSHFKSCKFPCFERNPQQTDPFLESKTVPSSPVWSFSFLAQNRNLSLIKSQHLLRLSIIYHASEKNAWRTSSHHYQATLARMLRHDILQTQISNAVSSLLGSSHAINLNLSNSFRREIRKKKTRCKEK